MQNSSSPNVPALAFNGVEIHDRNEMLCLTDMWAAAGSDDARRPSDWLALATTKEFVALVEASFNAGNSGIMTKKGKNGGTYAHWQIGLAYAKYLSPEFHMWCNTVVRERMEGKTATTALSAEALDEITRTFGIVRSTIHKVTEMEKAMNTLPALVEAVSAMMAIVQPSVPGLVIRHGRTAGATLKANGFTKCPKGLATRIGNWLETAGCRVDGRVDTGMCRARLFDPDKAEAWFKAGGRAAVEREIAERRGQGALALTGRAPRPTVMDPDDLLRFMPPHLRKEGMALIVINGEPVLYNSLEFDPDHGDKVVVLLANGEFCIDVADGEKGFRAAKHFASHSPRHCWSSERPMESVKGRPTTGALPGYILGKVVDRGNVITLPPRENAAH